MGTRTLLGVNSSVERFESMFAEHAHVVHRFVLRRIDPARAEDVVAEVFLTAWRRLSDVPEGAERPWLLTTARWVIANQQRSARRQLSVSERLAAEPDPPAYADPAEQVADTEVVRAALSRLSSRDQEVLRLAEWDQLSPRECAQILGCTPATFAVRLHRARRRFAEALTGDDVPSTHTTRRMESRSQA